MARRGLFSRLRQWWQGTPESVEPQEPRPQPARETEAEPEPREPTRRQAARNRRLPSIGNQYRGPRTDKERQQLNTQRLPILTRDQGRPLKWVRARDLTQQERSSIIHYWLALWDFLEGYEGPWSEWSGGSFTIGGYEVETSDDFIEDYANSHQLPNPHDDLYRDL